MVYIHLDEEERTMLLQLLDTCASDLRQEIADTENYNYKNMLKQRREVLLKLTQALQSDQLTEAMT
jgi:TRAP-type C4-dicarboxylate transport system substrate-binding protein